MGARISGAGESTLEVEGVEALTGASHTILADRIEAGTYLIGAAMTGGKVTVRNAVAADLAPLLELLAECGCQVETSHSSVTVAGPPELEPGPLDQESLSRRGGCVGGSILPIRSRVGRCFRLEAEDQRGSRVRTGESV